MARTKATATEAERRSTARKAKQCQTKYKNDEEPEKTTTTDSVNMEDKQLLQALRALGANVGPVNDGTRAVYQRRLGKLMKEKGLTNIDEIVGGAERERSRVEDVEQSIKGKGKKDVNEKMAASKKMGKFELGKVTEENEEDEEIVESDVKIRGRKKTDDTAEEVKKDEPIEKQLNEEGKRQKGRKTRDKKVSFAQVDIEERKRSDEDENGKTENSPVQLQTKKREQSVQIIDVRRNEMEERGKEVNRVRNRSIRGQNLKINRAVVIEDEDEDEGRIETNAVNSMAKNEEKDEKKGYDNRNLSILNLSATENESNGDTEDKDEDEGEEEKENEKEVSNTTISFEMEEVENDSAAIDSEEEEDNGKEEEEDNGKEEDEEMEDSPQRIPMKMRPRLLSVDSPAVNIIRRSRLNREMNERRNEEDYEIEDERNMTIDIFNRRSLNSHRTTLDASHRKNSPDGSAEEGSISPQPLPRKISLILEESVDMEVSSGSKEKTPVDQTMDNYSLDYSEDMEITNGSRDEADSSQRVLKNLSRRLFHDETENSERSNRDETLKLRQVNKNDSILIVDTPKSSRVKTEKTESVYGPRNIRKKDEKRREGDTFHIPHNRRWKEDDMADLPLPFEDSFTNFLDSSVGMSTFYNGIDNEGTNRMNSTRKCEANTLKTIGKTFVVKDDRKKENEHVNKATFVIPRRENAIGQREKSIRLTRNIVRSPSRSPARDPRRTYVIASSPSRRNSANKSSFVPTPIRSRPPPKPMPRRIKPDIQSSSPPPSSSIASFPSIPPVPAPRRIPSDKVGEKRQSRFDGINKVNEKRDNEMSPASLFNTQPRLGKKIETIERELTPIDRMNIKRLVSLREQMRQRKQVGRPSLKLDTEARMIIEDSPHLKRFFY